MSDAFETMIECSPSLFFHGKLRLTLVFPDSKHYSAIAQQVLRYGRVIASRGLLYLALRRYRNRFEPRLTSVDMAEHIQRGIKAGKQSLFAIVQMAAPRRPRRLPPYDHEAEEVAQWLWECCANPSQRDDPEVAALLARFDEETRLQLEAEDMRQELAHERWLASTEQDDEWEYLHREDTP